MLVYFLVVPVCKNVTSLILFFQINIEISYFYLIFKDLYLCGFFGNESLEGKKAFIFWGITIR